MSKIHLNTAKQAYAYLRVSSKAQLSGHGFERQRTAIEEYADLAKIEIVRLFEERGVTGDLETMDRPSFSEMMAEILRNNVRFIIVERLDRFSRDLVIQELAIRELRGKGITLLSAEPGEEDLMAGDSDPTKVLVRQLLGAIAHFDKSNLVAKLRAARMRNKAAGIRQEGQKPYGAREGEAEVLDTIRGLREKEGGSFEWIARILNLRGIPARHGRWHATSVRRTLAGRAQ